MTTNSDLRERAERIAKLEEIATEAKADVKAAYDAAKSAGFTPSALRKAIKIHTMDAAQRAKHDSAQMDLELYLAEIEGRRIEDARTITEASVAYLEQSRKIREAAE